MNLHALLKEQTQDLHSTIENDSVMSRLMQENLTPDEYGRLLLKLLSVHEFMENQLKQIPELHEAVPDFSRRQKSESLKKDLKALGMIVPKDFSLKTSFRLQNVSEAMGAMYVLEGSSLGGQVIAKKLKQHRFISQHTLNFFSHYGAETGLLWRQFLTALEKAEIEGRIDSVQAVHGARSSFQFLL